MCAQVSTTKGTGGDIIILEEAAQVDRMGLHVVVGV